MLPEDDPVWGSKHVGESESIFKIKNVFFNDSHTCAISWS